MWSVSEIYPFYNCLSILCISLLMDGMGLMIDLTLNISCVGYGTENGLDLERKILNPAKDPTVSGTFPSSHLNCACTQPTYLKRRKDLMIFSVSVLFWTLFLISLHILWMEVTEIAFLYIYDNSADKNYSYINHKAENISFGSGSVEPQVRNVAAALYSFRRYLENYLFWT